MKRNLKSVFEEIGYMDKLCYLDEHEEIENRFEKIRRTNRIIKDSPGKKYKYPSLAQHLEALRQ